MFYFKIFSASCNIRKRIRSEMLDRFKTVLSCSMSLIFSEVTRMPMHFSVCSGFVILSSFLAVRYNLITCGIFFKLIVRKSLIFFD